MGACTTPLLWLMQGVGMVVDILLCIPSVIIQCPWQVWKADKRIKGKPQNDDYSQPWRATDHFDTLTTTPFEGVQTLRDLFEYSINRFKHLPILGTREVLQCEDEVQTSGRVFKKLILGAYSWTTYAQVEERVDNIGRGLIGKLGLHPGDKVCIFMETRAEWLILAWVCFKYNFQLVTIYATLGEEGILHGLNETEAKVLITSAELLTKLQKSATKLPKLRYVVCCPSFTVTHPNTEIGGQIYVFPLAKVENPKAIVHNTLHKELPKESEPKPDDVAVIMYTSGTTGPPKGVMLTHANILAALSGQCQRILDIGQHDRYLAYLPLAHVLELTAELGCFIYGARMGYSSPGTITDQSSMIKKGSTGDATVLQPTLVACVPTVMDRIYKTVWNKVHASGALADLIFRFAYKYKLRNYNWGFRTPLTDRFVFKKIQQVLGGQVRLMICGSAPLNVDTQQFMQVVFGCTVGQGYGLTETTGAGTVQEVADRSAGNVGHPVWCCQIMLRDWAEGGYLVCNKRPQGELLVGGAHVAKGYFKNQEKTKQDFMNIHGVNYFCTGDIGEFQPNGTLKIIDRKKDLVKLQHGEYISLGKVECVLKNVPLVDNICVYADSSKDYVIALVQANQQHLKAIGKELGMGSKSAEDLCKETSMAQHVQQLFVKKAKDAKLEKWEVPKRVGLLLDIWTPDNSMLSDTLKLKRKNIENGYKSVIQELYK